MYSPVNVIFCSVIAMVYYTGITNGNGVWRYIAVDIRPWANHHVITDGNVTHNNGVDTYPYIVANGWHTLSPSTILLSDGHTLMDIDVLA